MWAIAIADFYLYKKKKNFAVVSVRNDLKGERIFGAEAIANQKLNWILMRNTSAHWSLTLRDKHNKILLTRKDLHTKAVKVFAVNIKYFL